MVELRADDQALISIRSLRRIGLGLACLGGLMLSACSQQPPEQAPPPPPPPMMDEAPSPPELAGGPAMERAPRHMRHMRPGWGTMAPIPNPGDMTDAERDYYSQGEPGMAPRDERDERPMRRREGGYRDHRAVVAMAPIPNPEEAPAAERPRHERGGWGHHRRRHGHYGHHHHRRHHGQWTAHAASHGRHGLVAPHATAPHVSPRHGAAATPTLAHGARPAVQALASALAGGVTRDAKLDVPTADLMAGKEARVTLSLPAALLQSIQAEAARLGLSRAASRANVSAELSGEGYSITPGGRQVAMLDAGKATSFSWLVRPTGDARGPLSAKVNAVLKGDGKHRTVPLLALQSMVAPPAPAEAEHRGLDLSALDIPGHEQLDLPVIGKVASHTVVALLFVALFILFLLAITGDGSRRRAAEEKRRWRRAVNDHDAPHGPKDFSAQEPTRHEDAPAPPRDPDHKPD